MRESGSPEIRGPRETLSNALTEGRKGPPSLQPSDERPRLGMMRMMAFSTVRGRFDFRAENISGNGKEGRLPRRTANFSLWGGPNFLVLVVHRVVPAKLATRKSDGFVLIGKRSHRLAARAHNPSCSRQ